MSWQVILTVLATHVLFTNGQLTQDQKIQLSLKARKLPNEICGESTIDEQTVIDDIQAHLGAYPWMAAIGYTIRSPKLLWMCGGCLVTNQFVLTVAHCLNPGRDIILKMVRLGDLDLNDSVSDGASPVDIEVESAKLHPNYNNTQKTNDIGLIKLKTKVKFDDLKKPICLPSPEFYLHSFEGYSAVIIGFGKVQNGETTSLSQAAVQIKDFVSCKRNITKSAHHVIVDERVLCASAPGTDSCQGDSGGPLMMYRKYRGKTKMFLLGLVSYGVSCTVDGYPGVYTRVSSFMDWIIDNLEL